MREPGTRLRGLLDALLLGLLADGFMAVAGGGRFGWRLCVAVAAALTLRAALIVRGRALAIAMGWEWGAYLLYAPVFAADYYLLQSDMLTALLHLLVYSGVVKLFTAHRNRDYLVLRLIAAVEIVVAATLTAPAAFLAYLIVFVILMVSGFAAQEVFSSLTQAQAGAAPPPPVWPERRVGPVLLRFSLLLSLGVMGLACVVFFVLPRTTLGGDTPQGVGAALTGFSDDVELGAIGQLQQSDATVMHVRITESQPRLGAAALQQVRFRGRALTDFDGRRWSADAQPSRYATQYGQLTFRNSPYPRTPSQLLRYQVTLEPMTTPVLFYPARLLETTTRLSFLDYDRDTATVTGSGVGSSAFGGISYSGISDLAQPADGLLRQAGSPHWVAGAASMAEFLALPPGLDPRIRALARAVTAGSDNNWDRLQALQAYLGAHFTYTLDDLPQGNDPLAEFLLDQRSGDCEYFATALAVMARSLGIPTRLVNGFLLGSYNPLTGEYIVAARQAHSWVEAYFPAPSRAAGGTWVTLDPTPPSEDGGLPAVSGAALMLDAISSQWQEWVVNYDWLHQAALARATSRGLRDSAVTAWFNWRRWYESGVASVRERRWRDLPVWSWAVLILLLGLAAVLVRRRGRRPGGRGRRRSGPADAWAEAQARWHYRRFLRLLQRAGYRRHAADTPEELVARLGAGARPPAAAFVAGYQALRFGAASAPEAVAEQCRALSRQLAALAPLLTKRQA